MLFIIYFILSAQTLLKLTGKLISTKFIVETILQLKANCFIRKQKKNSLGIKKTNDYNATNEEILYWRFSIRNLNNKMFREYRIPPFLFSQMQVITDYLLFIRLRVIHLFPIKMLINQKRNRALLTKNLKPISTF